ncbi:sigma factor-like helix-turn-helix DNA-binding protein [Variovorax sp. LjRoot290]|uniref:sigma factor-like helix-turn-helix DNA-binding protein n=1 Tax=Variovorax sp. LjRoot290 TaxID=3342316 RepID=UPI003ED0B9EC
MHVKITEDWRRALTDEERLRLLPLIATDDALRSFPERSLRSVKDAMGLPVAVVLGVLAKLEALYWVSTPWKAAPSTAVQSMADSPMDAALIAEVRAVLATQWVAELKEDDLRFPGVDGMAFPEWLSRQLGGSVSSELSRDLCRRLVAANRASWKEELADVALHAIERADPRPGSSGAKLRWISMFELRYGRARGLELQAIGDRLDLTRERVRQICEAILTAMKSQSVKMPALERTLAAAARVMPLPLDEADGQLSKFLGEGYGLRAAIQFAEALGVANPIRRTHPKARTSAGYKPVPMFESSANPAEWMTAALAHARRDCTFVGCTNLLRVAGMLALQEGVAQDAETLQGLFAQAPGFRMLDPDAGWFTLADSENSALASRLRKLMSVATGSVDLDTVASALMTDDRWLYRDSSRALAVPPLHVLSELFSGWDWLIANAHNRYVLKLPVEPTDVLSRSEFAAVEAILKLGSAATRREVAKVMMDGLGVTSMAVSHALATSPAIQKLDAAIYGVRGRPIPTDALVAARVRRAAEQGKPGPEPGKWEANFAEPLCIQLTQSGSSVDVALRVVYLPARLTGKVAGIFTDANGVLPTISVKSNNQIRRLAAAAHQIGVMPGERFEIAFDVPNRTYRIERLPSESSA